MEAEDNGGTGLLLDCSKLHHIRAELKSQQERRIEASQRRGPPFSLLQRYCDRTIMEDCGRHGGLR